MDEPSTFLLNEPSEEQSAIVSAALEGKNLICDSVAGSGKTTTILHIAIAFAEQYEHKNILQITYNARLKNEVRSKVSHLKLPNIDIHSYHGLNLKYYNGHTDKDIIDTIKFDKPVRRYDKFDLIIIDEAQDMTPPYYSLIKKYIKDNNRKIQLILMGDSRQSIYGYNGAKPDYLSKADEYWPYTFKRLQLTTSYRLTPETAAFVNNCMLSFDLIKTIKPNNKKVRYLANHKPIKDSSNNWDYTYGICDYLLEGVKAGRYLPEDIFILLPSIRQKNNKCEVTQLINNLSKGGVDIYKAMDDDTFSETHAKGKVALSTFHSVKGLERPVVVIFKFCGEYFDYYAKDLNPKECPEVLYVAATRSSRELIVYQNGSVIPFLNIDNIHEIADVSGEIDKIKKKQSDQIKTIAITDIVRYLSPELTYRIKNMIDPLFTVVQENKKEITLSNDLITNCCYEQVADLNGLAIVAKFEEERTGNCSIMLNESEIKDPELKEGFNVLQSDYTSKPKDLEYYLRLANIYWSVQEELIYRFRQIKSYTWLNDVNWDNLKLNMSSISDSVKYEQKIGKGVYYAYKRTDGKILYLSGIVDGCDNDTVWEFKCTDEIRLEHKLQLLFYSLMLKILPFNSTIEWENLNFNLLNVRTGVILKLKNDYGVIEEIAKLIINKKIITMPVDSEDAMREPGPFIKQIRSNNMKIQPIRKKLQPIRKNEFKNTEKNWNIRDDKILTESYKQGLTYEELSKKLKRTQIAIKLRLLHLGLANKTILQSDDHNINKTTRDKPKNNQQKWLPNDDQLLSKYYKQGSNIEELSIRFERTNKAIEARLLYLGVINNTKSQSEEQISDKNKPKNAWKKWSIDDDRLLKELYEQRINVEELATKFERSNGSVISRLISLGLINSLGLPLDEQNAIPIAAALRPKNAGKKWTSDDEQLLIELYKQGMNEGELATKFERTKHAITIKLTYLGMINKDDAKSNIPQINKPADNNTKSNTSQINNSDEDDAKSNMPQINKSAEDDAKSNIPRINKSAENGTKTNIAQIIKLTEDDTKLNTFLVNKLSEDDTNPSTPQINKSVESD
jgi:hypothetical protein